MNTNNTKIVDLEESTTVGSLLELLILSLISSKLTSNFGLLATVATYGFEILNIFTESESIKDKSIQVQHTPIDNKLYIKAYKSLDRNKESRHFSIDENKKNNKYSTYI